VTGFTIETPNLSSDLYSGSKNSQNYEKIDPEPLAILAFIVAILGLILTLIKGHRHLILLTLLGVIVVISLLFLESKMDNEALKNGLEVKYDIGFWGSLLLFLISTGLNWYLFSQREPMGES